MARTNIDIDEEAVAAEALSLEEALAMQGSGWEGDLREMRSGRVL